MRPSRGSSIFTDIKTSLPNFNGSIIFDVGANVGNVSKQFARSFPHALLHAFEPVPSTFHDLVENTKGLSIRCHNIALSDSNGVAKMQRQGDRGLFTLEVEKIEGDASSDTVDVPMTTLDDFCGENRINRINYLKIDAGGHDLSVLQGTKQQLERQAVEIVEVEAGMNPDSKIFSSFEDMKAYLEQFDYRLFALYEQMHEFKTNAPHLRRVNAVFLSRRTIEDNTKR